MWILGLALTLGACGGGTTAPHSSMPRITVGSTGALGAGLLTSAQIGIIGGLTNPSVSSLSKSTFFEDPDPRGPCGARVPKLDLSHAAGVAVTSGEASGAELIVRRTDARAYATLLRNDARDGCADYSTTTHAGDTQTVRLIRIVPLDVVADQSLAIIRAVKVRSVVRAQETMVVTRGPYLASLVLFGGAPLGDQTIGQLADAMAHQLASLSDS